jgi:hypothetical protein
MEYYYLDSEGKQIGPISEAIIGQLYSKGVISKNTLLWREGLASWKEYQHAFEMQRNTSEKLKPPKPPEKINKNKKLIIATICLTVFLAVCAFLMASKGSYEYDSWLGHFFSKRSLKEIAKIHNEKMPLKYSDGNIVITKCYPNNKNKLYYYLNINAQRKHIDNAKENNFEGLLLLLFRDKEIENTVEKTLKAGASSVFMYHTTEGEFFGENEINEQSFRKLIEKKRQNEIADAEREKKSKERELKYEKERKILNSMDESYKKINQKMAVVCIRLFSDKNVEYPIGMLGAINSSIIWAYEQGIKGVDAENIIIDDIEDKFKKDFPHIFPQPIENTLNKYSDQIGSKLKITKTGFQQAVSAATESVFNFQSRNSTQMNKWQERLMFDEMLEMYIDNKIVEEEAIRQGQENQKLMLLMEQTQMISEQNAKLDEQNELLKKANAGPSAYEKLKKQQEQDQRDYELRELRRLQDEQTTLQRKNNQLLEEQNKNLRGIGFELQQMP